MSGGNDPRNFWLFCLYRLESWLARNRAMPWIKNLLRLSLRPLGTEEKVDNYIHLPGEKSWMWMTVILNFLKLFEQQLLGMRYQTPSLRMLKAINSLNTSKIHWKCCITQKILSRTCPWIGYRDISPWH